MNRRRIVRRLTAVLLLAPAPAVAGEVPAPCEEAAHYAETANGIPSGLLLAIGRVESGRGSARDPRIEPWPWTVNVDGKGAFFSSRALAVDYVRATLAAGARSVDVGCFQVNLGWHGAAFPSLDDAFEPAGNAFIAARFLTLLHRVTADWGEAIGRYHSATPTLQLPYRELVMTSWARGAAGTGYPALAVAPDPVVVLMSATARSVHVWYGPGLPDPLRPALSPTPMPPAR